MQYNKVNNESLKNKNHIELVSIYIYKTKSQRYELKKLNSARPTKKSGTIRKTVKQYLANFIRHLNFFL